MKKQPHQLLWWELTDEISCQFSNRGQKNSPRTGEIRQVNPPELGALGLESGVGWCVGGERGGTGVQSRQDDTAGGGYRWGAGNCTLLRSVSFMDFPTESPLVTLYLKVQVFTQNKRSVNKNDTDTILYPVDHRRSNGWTTAYTGEGVGEGRPLLAGCHIWEPLVGNVAELIWVTVIPVPGHSRHTFPSVKCR